MTTWEFSWPKGFSVGNGISPAKSGSPVIGRVNAVAYDPLSQSTYYVGAADGGVWKTTDGGSSWAPLTDSWSSLYVSSIATAINASNPKQTQIYVGTGDWPGQRGTPIGVWQSPSGGANWSKSLESNLIISCVAVHPDDNRVIFAVEWGGSLWRFDGTTWSVPATLKAYATQNWMGIVFGLKINGVRPCYAICEGSGGTIFRSTDEGNTWTAITYPNIGEWQLRSMLVTSASTPGRLYLCLPNANPTGKVYQGADDPSSGKTTWEDITGVWVKDYIDGKPQETTEKKQTFGQGTYNFTMACGTTVIRGTTYDVVYVGLATLNYRIIGLAGTDWESFQQFENGNAGIWYGHYDQHALAVDPRNSSNLLSGCDGGVFRIAFDSATDPPVTMQSLNADLRITQCYKIACSPDWQYFLAGCQDVGSPGKIPGQAISRETNGGDGGACAINPSNPHIQYTTGDFGGGSKASFRRTDDGWTLYYSSGGTSGFQDISLGAAKTERGWLASPMALDPSNPNLLYLATDYLYQWNEAAQKLTPRLGGTSLSSSGWVNGIAIAAGSSQRIYTCSNDGEVYISQDQGGRWKNITANLPGGSFNAVSAANPVSVDDVLVGIASPSAGGTLWRCENASSAEPVWTDVSGTSSGRSLPSGQVHAILRDEKSPSTTWYVATDVGVYKTTNAGADWDDYWSSLGAPVVQVRDLISVGCGQLRAGTFGRGVWEYFPSKPFQVPGAQTDTAPALAGPVFTGLNYAIYYIAWKDPNGDIYVSVSTTSSDNPNTFKWNTPAQIKGSGWAALTDDAPALGLTEDGILYAAWKGKGGEQIWYSSSSDGVTWQQQSTVPGAKTDHTPSLHMAAGLPVPMTVAWCDADGSTIKYAAFPRAGEGWGAIPSIGSQTDSAPALSSTGAADDTLVFVWLKAGSKQLMFTTVDSNTGPGGATPQEIVGASSTTAASLGGGGMAWKGESPTSANVWVTAITSPFPPTASQPITPQRLSCLFTDVAPAWLGGALAFKVIGGTTPVPIFTCFPWA